jgi:hypothetical protein
VSRAKNREASVSFHIETALKLFLQPTLFLINSNAATHTFLEESSFISQLLFLFFWGGGYNRRGREGWNNRKRSRTEIAAKMRIGMRVRRRTKGE